MDCAGKYQDWKLDRVSKLLSVSTEMWIDIQAQYDVWKISKMIDKIKVKPLKPH